MRVFPGVVDMTINGMSNILPHIGTGKLKALAVSTVKRNPLAPDVPTMQEAGVPGYSSQGSFGLFAPVGLPREIADKVSADTKAVLETPEIQKMLEARSFVVEAGTPAEFRSFIAAETEKWRSVINRVGIKID